MGVYAISYKSCMTKYKNHCLVLLFNKYAKFAANIRTNMLDLAGFNSLFVMTYGLVRMFGYVFIKIVDAQLVFK